MSTVAIRDALIKGLYRYLGGDIPVYRSGQTSGELMFPYILYTVTAANGGGNTTGHYSVRKKGDGAEEIKEEQAFLTMSFTICSQNHTDALGNYIQGEDEAQEIAERAHGWFTHAGYDDFTKCGIVIADVTEVHGRNALMGNEEANRKGFDVICNYINGVSRDISVVDKVMAGREKDERRGSVCQSG